MENVLESIKAAIAGVLISVLFAFLLALIAKFAPMGQTAQLVVAQTLKGLSLAVGCFLFFRKPTGRKQLQQPTELKLIFSLVFLLFTYITVRHTFFLRKADQGHQRKRNSRDKKNYGKHFIKSEGFFNPCHINSETAEAA